MKVSEQLLMSYLIDQNNLAVLLARLSPREVSLFKEDLFQLSASVNMVQTRLEELLTSKREMPEGGMTCGNTSG